MTAARAVLLLVPIVVLNLAAFAWPVARLARISLIQSQRGGALTDTVTLANYATLLGDRTYLDLLANSLGLGVVVTLATLVCAYPLALFLHRASRRWQAFLFALTISPLLVSSVVRTYGWMALLGEQGPVNDALVGLGLVRAPVRLVNSYTGVCIGLVEILMPYMTLALVAGFGRLDPTYEEAAASLGAGPFQRTDEERSCGPNRWPSGAG